MKKSIIVGAMSLAMLGCGTDAETVTVLDAKCERVAVASNGRENFVVKCPITERLNEVRARTPDSMFIGPYDAIEPNTVDVYATATTDVEHIYVEVNPNASNGNQPIYRVMVQNPVIDGKTMFSVMAFEQQ